MHEVSGRLLGTLKRIKDTLLVDMAEVIPITDTAYFVAVMTLADHQSDAHYVGVQNSHTCVCVCWRQNSRYIVVDRRTSICS